MDWKRRRTLPTGIVNRVGIVGGTHGNESNGVWLAKHLQRNPQLLKRPSFEAEVHLSNLAAIEKNVRYVEEDMNRCFYLKDLTNDALSSLEAKRAKEVDKLLGPKASGEPRCDFILDLHNTTAATGIALLCAPNDDFALEVCQHLRSLDPSVRIVLWNAVEDWAVCPSVGRSGMTFEVGPAPWGCVIGDLYKQSLTLLLAAMDYIEAHNQLVGDFKEGKAALEDLPVPVFCAAGKSIDYPRAEDKELTGMVHPELQGKDFKEMAEGDPLFMKFDGEVVPFRRADHGLPDSLGPLHALFVNEAAYYEKGMALMLVKADTKTIRILRKSTA